MKKIREMKYFRSNFDRKSESEISDFFLIFFRKNLGFLRKTENLNFFINFKIFENFKKYFSKNERNLNFSKNQNYFY